MVARKAARFLAPLALLATIVAVYLVVHSTLNSKTATTTTTPVLPTTAHGHRHGSAPKFYIVKGGDTMSRIAAKTGIPLNTLEGLNPSVQPDALQTGQRLRLRR